MKKVFWTIFCFMFLVGGSVAFVKWYKYIFARTVHGVIVSVERPAAPTALVGVGAGVDSATAALFSFAVAIKEKSGEIVTASTEDRQWAVAQTGRCVEAKYYPYPPWNFEKSGTYHDARLLKLYDCGQPIEQPAAESAP